MIESEHIFHIPVMGTGHSADTAVRLAPLGITSVISFVDDIILEKVRKYYSDKFNIRYTKIPVNEHDGRAKRIKAYLETVKEIVKRKFADIKQEQFSPDSDKTKYFDLLPDSSALKQSYIQMLSMPSGEERKALTEKITDKMRPGAIDVNIMVKLDRVNYNKDGTPMAEEFSDSKSALRGYAESSLSSSVIFSAGMNQTLFSYLSTFKDFYRDGEGIIKKKIILKVSDFRSALIQGKFLAKKGLEVYEFRVESGLNCGGHAFPTKGNLMPAVLKEFKEKRATLATTFLPLIKQYYEKQNLIYPECDSAAVPLISVQGGFGSPGELKRVFDEYQVDRVGCCTPFLFVPEATSVDATTMELLFDGNVEDCYLSNVSPLGVPFNNLRNTGSERWTTKKNDESIPGSPCPKGFLVSDTEFTDKPICVASRLYQKKKIEQIENLDIPATEREKLINKVVEKTCICDHLGNGVLIALGIVDEKISPQSICPGPNAAWFNRAYTLKEMVDYIYGRGESLVSTERPHMFAKEIDLYVEHFENLTSETKNDTRGASMLAGIRDNLFDGMDICLDLAKKDPFPGENLDSITACVETKREKINSLYDEFIE